MRATFADVLADATRERRAVAACNVYTLDQAAGVLDAATASGAPLILQVHPSGLGDGLWAMLGGVRVLADDAPLPCIVHLDHCSDLDVMERASLSGVDSVMVDGSALPLVENRDLVVLARNRLDGSGVGVEAELGRISGSEDGLSVDEREARLTDPSVVARFVAATGIAALAVSIGNVHGDGTRVPSLDLVRLAAIRDASPVPLVLHGASGLGPGTLAAAIACGVAKVNINTELRRAYVDGLVGEAPRSELVDVMHGGRAAVRTAAGRVIRALGGAAESRSSGWSVGDPSD